AVVGLIGDPAFVTSSRHGLALAQQHFDLTQLGHDLLRRETLFWHFSSPFLYSVSLFDWYKKGRSGQWGVWQNIASCTGGATVDIKYDRKTSPPLLWVTMLTLLA